MRPGDVRGRRRPEERVQECGSTHIYRDESEKERERVSE